MESIEHMQLTANENFGDLSITPWKQLIPDRSFVKEFLPSKGKVITGSNGRGRKKKSHHWPWLADKNKRNLVLDLSLKAT